MYRDSFICFRNVFRDTFSTFHVHFRTRVGKLMKCQRISYHVSSRWMTGYTLIMKSFHCHQINLVSISIIKKKVDANLNNFRFKNLESKILNVNKFLENECEYNCEYEWVLVWIYAWVWETMWAWVWLWVLSIESKWVYERFSSWVYVSKSKEMSLTVCLGTVGVRAWM